MSRDKVSSVKPPSIPSISEDGTVNPNGLRLGRQNQWEYSDDPYKGRFADFDEDGPKDLPCPIEDCE